jgi:RimJ/RimL family protein N-acetyltransferase
MNGMDSNQLAAYLWPHGDSLSGPQVHLLLDGARDPEAVAMVRFGKLEYSCLFSGRLTPRLQAAAPYLVHLAAGSPLSRQLLERVWGRSGGILTVARADVTLEQQRLHFKKFLRVQDEAGRVLQFRFYDPRVLRIYLPTCTADELQCFFGPVSRIVMEPADGGAPLDYALQYGALAPGRNAESGRPARLGGLASGHAAQQAALVALDPPGHGPEALDSAPLGLHHVQAYHRLQNDEEIRRWTGLPLHLSVADAREWMRRQLERKDAGIRVIRHPDHGIVGALSLEQQGPAALGYCWIGRDYQRRGYGHVALRLLHDFARSRGVQRLYASADGGNAAAHKLLQRAGARSAGDGQPPCYLMALSDAAAALAPELLAAEVARLRREPARDGLQCT